MPAGMNEILAPLYYIMTTDCDPEWKGTFAPRFLSCLLEELLQ
jgi:hypothetical protein